MPPLWRDLSWPVPLPFPGHLPSHCPVLFSSWDCSLLISSAVSVQTHLPPSARTRLPKARALAVSLMTQLPATCIGGQLISIFSKNTFPKKNKDLGVCPWPFENNVVSCNQLWPSFLFLVRDGSCSCGVLLTTKRLP